MVPLKASSLPLSLPSQTSARSAGRVLIVDDDRGRADAVRTVLAEGGRGVTIEIASNCDMALSLANRGFDVALVGATLGEPRASGIQGSALIDSLRTASPLAEVIAVAWERDGFEPSDMLANVEHALFDVRRKREREELERRYRDLVDVTDVLVFALDADDNVALMNRKAAGMVNTSPESALGKPFLEAWLPEEDRTGLRGALASTRDSHGHQRPHDIETGFVDQSVPSTSRRRVRWHLSCSPDPTAGLVYGIGIDITERRALEKRAADAEALSAMGELAMNLAHEIRNPLNAAVLQLHLLNRNLDRLEADPPTRAAMKDRVRIVGDEIGRLSRLLTEFLELARPRGIAREPVHVPRLVDEVLDLEAESARGRGIEIQRELPEDGCVAIGDREKLKQVTINIVVNALEAMKQGGVLKVTVRSAGESVIMSVEDTGPGIDAAVLASVFDPFFTTKEAGTGLGLSIVRKIVDQHGGDVVIDSVLGRGARVTVSIPMGR